jgi:hypothetical protein
MRTRKLSRIAARDLAEKQGINFKKDFFTLRSSEVETLLAIAKLNGYRKPANANGSKGRYFYAYLQRVR